MRGPILAILGILAMLGLSQLGDGGRADARPVRHGSEEHGAAEVQSAAQETGICQQAAPQAPCRVANSSYGSYGFGEELGNMLENSAFQGGDRCDTSSQVS